MCTSCNHKMLFESGTGSVSHGVRTSAETKKPSQLTKAQQKAQQAVTVPAEHRKPVTHEAFVQAVYALACRLPTLTDADRKALKTIKLTYGAGPDGARGVTYYQLWAQQGKKDAAPQAVPFVAICATGQSDYIQLIGTTLHELGHVIAGWKAGHGPEWNLACARLGLLNVKAAGTEYSPDNLMADHGFRKALLALPKPKDGSPVNALGTLPPGMVLPPGLVMPTLRLKPCTAGYGSKGGRSRGAGSGSRLLKFTCGCTIVRASAGAGLSAKCLKCGNEFKRDGEQPTETPPAAPVPTDPKGKLAKVAKMPKGTKAQVTAGHLPAAPAKAPARKPKMSGAQAAIVSAAVNAPLPINKGDGGSDLLATILQAIDPK